MEKTNENQELKGMENLPVGELDDVSGGFGGVDFSMQRCPKCGMLMPAVELPGHLERDH